MFDFIFTSPTRLIAAICFFGIVLAGLTLTLMHLGQRKEQVKTLKSDIKAVEKSNEIENKNKQLTDDELNSSLRKWVRKK